MSLSTTELDLLYTTATTSARVEQVATLTQQICAIAAPTGDEWQRAEFVASLFKARGYDPEIDDIGNVYIRRGSPSANEPVVMLLAHTDTVFPADTPLQIRQEGHVLYGPGIGDNSLSVATMISLFDMLDDLQWQTSVPIIAVANVGEEGLGNLLGARTAVQRYQTELGAVIAIDGNLGNIVTGAVGSKRWRVTVHGPGGHSFGSFGIPSAITGLCQIVVDISRLDVPREPKTTFNVGIIEGGTSINTIAASASALVDMRSTDATTLDRLAERVKQIIEQATGGDSQLRSEIEVLGERPSGEISHAAPLIQLATRCVEWVGARPGYIAASTDANIPLSMGIPAVCVGTARVERAHSLEEHVDLTLLGKGLAQLLRLTIESCTLAASG